MFKKLSLSIVISILCVGLAYAWGDGGCAYKRKLAAEASSPVKTVEPANAFGGWSPIFFSSYDETKINQIITMIKEDKIKKIDITYPTQATKLAEQISNKLKAKEPSLVTMNPEKLTNTKDIQYDYTRVSVVLYYK